MSTRGLDRAFPLENPRTTRQLGMTIREYALIHITAGLVANPADYGPLPERALRLADELLAALGDTPEEP